MEQADLGGDDPLNPLSADLSGWHCASPAINLRPLSIKGLRLVLAEREGFEPPVSCPTSDFESGAFNHSAISPGTRGLGPGATQQFIKTSPALPGRSVAAGPGLPPPGGRPAT